MGQMVMTMGCLWKCGNCVGGPTGWRGEGQKDGAARPAPSCPPVSWWGLPPREARGYRMTHPCQQVPCCETRVALYPGDHWDTS